MKDKTKLAVIDGETLMDMRLVPTKFCVDTLLPQGICKHTKERCCIFALRIPSAVCKNG